MAKKPTLNKQLGSGMDGLAKRLDQMQFKDRQTRQFLKTVLRPVAKTAAKLAPPPGYPGDKPDKRPLKDTLRVGAKSYRSHTVWYGVVGPVYSNVPGEGGNHGHLVEFGTDPHEVKHPGSQPHPFLAPAWAQHKARILTSVKEFMGKELTTQLTQPRSAQQKALADLRRLSASMKRAG